MLGVINTRLGWAKYGGLLAYMPLGMLYKRANLGIGEQATKFRFELDF
jgi:hypothetical protein